MALIASAALVVFVTPAAATNELVAGEKAVVAGTDGEGLNLRTEPHQDSSIEFTAVEGTALEITGGPQEIDGITWYSVRVDGNDAWVQGEYLHGTPSVAGDQVQVVKTDGHGLRLRSGASYDASTITILPAGSVLTIIGDELTDETGVTWAHVDYNGSSGYAHRDYLAILTVDDHEVIEAQPSEPESEPEQPPVEEEIVDEPEADDQGSEPDDSHIEAPEDVSNPEPDPEPDPAPEPQEPAEITVGGNAQVVNTGGAGLNVRHGAGYGNGVMTVAAEGHVMQVIGGPHVDADGGNWWNVDYRGLDGWVHGDYLQPTNAEPTGAGSASGAGNPGSDDGETAPPPPASATGERLVNEAMRYLGYPYVWGGTTPSGFDCSGFIYYVVNQVTGGGFPRGMEAQVNRGTYVPSDQLQPGDLVFQQNTYQWGLSHAGIYIGNGQFIHASTPGSGVIISNLWDSYWGPRYYTARRIS